jgi:hypothetical protein
MGEGMDMRNGQQAGISVSQLPVLRAKAAAAAVGEVIFSLPALIPRL